MGVRRKFGMDGDQTQAFIREKRMGIHLNLAAVYDVLDMFSDKQTNESDVSPFLSQWLENSS